MTQYTVDDKLHYQAGIKYLVARQWEWKLKGDFHPKSTFWCSWYALSRRADGWYLVAHEGCGWDGATWFPDFGWIMQASLGHDILHWLIARGIIPESENDLIDAELAAIVKERAKAPKIGGETLLRLRAWYAEKGTNLVNQKLSSVHKVYIV